MLHLSTVESTTLELLKKLQQLPVLCNTRLVGGTALALQLGHRKSVDLDFFGQINVDSQDLKEALRTLGTLTILNDSKNIHIYVLNEVKIDIVNYTYPWLAQKYPDSSSFMAMKSLAYFGDADFDVMPYMFSDITWDEIKEFIINSLTRC